MKSMFLVFSASCALSRAAECQSSDEASLLQSRRLVRTQQGDKKAWLTSLRNVANSLAEGSGTTVTSDEVQTALSAAADALAVLSPAIQNQIVAAQQEINSAAGVVQACCGHTNQRTRLQAHVDEQHAAVESCEAALQAATAEEEEACARAEDCLCDEARTHRTDQTEICASVTTVYELAFCEHHELCEVLHECHGEAVASYDTIKAEIEAQLEQLQQEYIASEQAVCLNDLIIEAMTPPLTPIPHDRLLACDDVDASAIAIEMPEMPEDPEACPEGDVECDVAANYDSRLSAYWDTGGCGVHGNDWNWDWCGRQAGNCPETVQVDSSLCESGSAVLDTMFGTGEVNSYTRHGCNYFYHAQYVCEAPAPAPAPGLPAGHVGVFNQWSASAGVHVVGGDFNGDGDHDVALLGGPGWGSIPVAHSRNDGRFSVTNCGVQNMNAWIRAAGAHPLVGDFNGDGKDDIALVGGHGWGSIPVAFSEGELGCFRVTNNGVANFPTWAAVANVQEVVGDFNGDGKADIAAIGSSGWATLPTAFSNGDGSFRVTNVRLGGSFNAWSATAGVRVLAGDFNADGKDDVALIGGPGWATMPVALSAGDGSYNQITNCRVDNFNSWIRAAGARPLVGDFNGDGRDDVALTGGRGWATIPVAFSQGNQCWRVTNTRVDSFPAWAATDNVQAVSADVNGDGKADIAAIGRSGWATLPVAFGSGDGSFRVVNERI